MPTELIEASAKYLSDTDLLCFRLSCRRAEEKTLRLVGERFFSTFKTNLMRSDIDKLDIIARDGRLSKYVKAIRIQDDEEKITKLFPYRTSSTGTDLDKKGRNQERENTRAAYRMWPREQGGVLGIDRIVVAKLVTILKEGHLSLDTLAIYDYLDDSAQRNIQYADILAETIILYPQLAITSIRVSRTGSLIRNSTLVTYSLDHARQGENVGLSLLRKAEYHDSSGDPSSYCWGSRLFDIAPALDNLQVEFWVRADADLSHQETSLKKFTVRLSRSRDLLSVLLAIRLGHP